MNGFVEGRRGRFSDIKANNGEKDSPKVSFVIKLVCPHVLILELQLI